MSDENFDDSTCATCGEHLDDAKTLDEQSWEFQGFCDGLCCITYYANTAMGGLDGNLVKRAANELWRKANVAVS